MAYHGGSWRDGSRGVAMQRIWRHSKCTHEPPVSKYSPTPCSCIFSDRRRVPLSTSHRCGGMAVPLLYVIATKLVSSCQNRKTSSRSRGNAGLPRIHEVALPIHIRPTIPKTIIPGLCRRASRIRQDPPFSISRLIIAGKSGIPARFNFTLGGMPIPLRLRSSTRRSNPRRTSTRSRPEGTPEERPP
jgi:hypothetical protein